MGVRAPPRVQIHFSSGLRSDEVLKDADGSGVARAELRATFAFLRKASFCLRLLL
jgi:hypothetical protein